MNWECLKCGTRNHDEEDECTKCHLDRYSAMNMIIQKRKRMCEECGHMHRQGLYCHVYTEAIDDLEEDEEEEEEASALTDSDDSDSDILGTGAVKEAEAMKLRPLKTPAFVKAIRYVRCNCDAGVPNDSKRFEPMPTVVQVGRIYVETYIEIMDPLERARFLKSSSDRYAETKHAARVKQRNVDISYCLPHILSYLPLGQCNQAPMVSTYWNYGTNLYTLYIDVRNCIPWQTFRVHTSQVDSVCIANGKLYTGGDKRVICSNYNSGEIYSTITRDSGDICCLFEHDGELFCCSTNGSIRTYFLTHTGKNIKPHVTMWDHTRAITQLLSGLPSEGVCTMHGISNHTCDMYTASEDRGLLSVRTIKHWNITKYKALRSISSKTFRTASVTKLAQSPRHLFCGTTNASIGVFCKFPYCERTDVHSCNIADADKHYCLQLTLKLPYTTMESGSPTTVTGLICAGPNYAFTHLWASDSTGQITIWYVPEYGLEFVPAYTVSAHKRTINNLVHTYRHAITISDDGFLKLFDLESFALIRQVDVLDWCINKGLMPTIRTDIPRRLKCIHLKEDSVNGGVMVVGTNYGDVMVFSLGTTV